MEPQVWDAIERPLLRHTFSPDSDTPVPSSYLCPELTPPLYMLLDGLKACARVACPVHAIAQLSRHNFHTKLACRDCRSVKNRQNSGLKLQNINGCVYS